MLNILFYCSDYRIIFVSTYFKAKLFLIQKYICIIELLCYIQNNKLYDLSLMEVHSLKLAKITNEMKS